MKTLFRSAVHFGCFIICAHGILHAQTPPTITTQPTSKAVTRGANVSFSVAVSGTNQVSYQWLLNQTELPSATNNILAITNALFAEAGDYQAVVANAAGSVTSLVARLAVGPAFLKVSTGAVAASSGGTGGAWGDFNNDGLVDLFVAIGNGSQSMLFTNAGNNGLVRDIAAGIGTGTGSSWGCAWGDSDNDGHLDLIGSVYGGNNYAFHNNGNDTFSRLTSDPMVSVGTGDNIIWGDYDNDGFLDAYCAGSANLLFHNKFGRRSGRLGTRVCLGRLR